MSRRYEEIEERARRDIAGAKTALKRLGDAERAAILVWLAYYFDDSGAMFSPQITRRRKTIVIDEKRYWLVRIPPRKGGP